MEPPTGKPGDSFEDYAIACIKAGGVTVEPRVIERVRNREIAEFDGIGTHHSKLFPKRLLIEAKLSDRSFSTLFKLFGQRTYLSIEDAALLSARAPDPEDTEAVARFEKRTSTSPKHVPYPPQGRVPPQRLLDVLHKELGLQPIPRSCELAYGYWLSGAVFRKAYEAFSRQRKSARGEADQRLLSQIEVARSYLDSLDKSFLEPSPLKRTEILYKAYARSPRLVDDTLQEVANSVTRSKQSIWADVNSSHRRSWIQFVMLLQARARNAIIRNALEFIEDSSRSRTSLRRATRSLPRSRSKPIIDWSDRPHRDRIPLLLQIYTEALGGFIHNNWNDEDILSEATGIPVCDLPDCLRIYDDFFPLKDLALWRRRPPNPTSRLLTMTLIPALAKGVGIRFRRRWNRWKPGKFPHSSQFDLTLLSSWEQAVLAF